MESTFSVLRATNTDTSPKIDKGIVAQNIINANKIVSGASYSAEHTIKENTRLLRPSHDIVAGPKQRKEWFDSMVEKRDKLNPKKSQDSRVESFPHTAEQDGNLEGRWKSIVGRVEDDPSFSAVLVENVAFRDWAEASTHNMDSQKWFERVILCSQDGDEEWLNSLCQNINQKLLLLSLETWSERKDGRVGASFFFKIIKMLQTPTLDGLLPRTPGHGERAAVVALILVLNVEMEKKDEEWDG